MATQQDLCSDLENFTSGERAGWLE